MIMTVKDSGDLVGGGLRRDNDDQLTVKALRGFMRNGEPVATGSVITLPVRLARALIGMNKAIVIAEPPGATATATATETDEAEAPRRGGRTKEKE